jgi:hypothetical protein
MVQEKQPPTKQSVFYTKKRQPAVSGLPLCNAKR